VSAGIRISGVADALFDVIDRRAQVGGLLLKGGKNTRLH
jgi:hypothetical protein